MRRCLSIALVVAALSPAALAWADTQKHVLVLYATRRDSQVAIIGDRQLPQMLQRTQPQPIDYYSEHLDLARFPDPGYQAAVADFLEAKYSEPCFDVVIAMHEVAFEFAAAFRHRLFPDAPLVFFSNVADIERVQNSTGVVAPTDFASTIDLAVALQPQLRNVFVISGADVRDRQFERAARAQLQRFEQRLAITYLAGLPTGDLKRRLASLPERSVVYYLVVNRDGDGASFHPLLYMEELAGVANAPVYGWVDSQMNRGILGGSLKNQARQVETVGDVAARVLRGENADAIPIATVGLNVRQLDWRQLRRWNMSATELPSDVQVLFEEPSLWGRFKIYIVFGVAALLAQSALIAGLLIQRSRRRQAETEVRGSQAALRSSGDRIRALGSRLLHAQDSERARIARELHDDISQQVALLSIDLEILKGSVPGDLDGLRGQALDRAHGIAKSVHDLAHRLYPAKLRLIGLVPALLALQREMERSDVVVNLVYEDVPSALPPDLTLCVFRVVQEALQNAVKHSGAREVSVRLTGSDGGLALTIADDGTGFDVDGAMGSGLGLISMRERLEAVGGTLAIQSAPGAGTRLEVFAPLGIERLSEAVVSGRA